MKAVLGTKAALGLSDVTADEEPVCIAVCKEYDVPYARQTAAKVSNRIAMSAAARHYLVTAVSELATNLCFHTNHGGSICVRVIKGVRGAGIEVVAEDDGPGIPDLDAAMREGFSTNGGLGGGLPGVQRLMDEFDLRSQAGKGTCVTARIWQR